MESPAYRLAHLSDVHFGRIDRPGIVEALVEEVNAAAMDLVVVSGDLTQRARRAQFLAARAFLNRFEAPVLVVPGNHDVPAWWHNPFARVFRPAEKYQRYITDDLTPSFTFQRDGLPPLSVLGVNSAHGLTIKGGLLREDHWSAITSFFESQSQDSVRVLALHHPLTRLGKSGNHDVAKGATETLFSAAEAHVSLVLSGHIHKSTVATVQLDWSPDDGGEEWSRRLVVASAGTATSNRSREVEGKRTNYYNWIRVGRDHVTIEERRFDHSSGSYGTVRTTSFEHPGDPGGPMTTWDG